MTDYKEKIEIYTKYLEKKSNLVGGKYLSLHSGFCNVVRSCEDGVSTCEVAHVCLEVVSQLRNTLQNFASGFHFAAVKFSHSLMQLSSNDHNFFVSTPIGTPFEALDF